MTKYQITILHQFSLQVTTIAVLLLAVTSVFGASNPLDLVEDLIAAPSSRLETLASSSISPPPPVKLDKNLRRALLKALTDLEAESAEQHQRERSTDDANQVASTEKATTVPVFGAKTEIKSSDPLETVESRSVSSTSASPRNVVNSIGSPSKTSTISSVQIQRSSTLAPLRETLTLSASGNLASAAANSLLAPRPTVSTTSSGSSSDFTTTISSGKGQANAGTKSSGTPPNKEDKAEDVKIFPAPLVAAFTVQQDERGIPKSVVPLFRTNGTQPAQPLSLQEQLEFKQRLLEKQLAQLQAQQLQQTQFLIRQRQAYEAQIRFKQQQELQLQEQRRLQEQQRLQQQLQQVFVPPPPTQFPVQQQQQQLNLLPQPPQPQLNLLPQPPQQLQAQQFNLRPQQQLQQNPQLSLNTKTTTSVVLQPSLALEVPSIAPAQVFQQQSQLRPRQQFPQQQVFQFQQPPSVTPLTRFNRQEGFGSVAGDLQGAGTRTQEDINIVSKVLALNVGSLPGIQRSPNFQQQQFSGLNK
ncbi:hypothetical protein QAD02_018772 [Eretmocerus hayati]|uniref:Uncharacterized protein n=1 Tax=Eretmocerus hayati TaxID=131215 RepID=A0ACC2PMG4_9HYME|nr:hypothetical protein QAD02_018772 [Eretmocerus hayati]